MEVTVTVPCPAWLQVLIAHVQVVWSACGKVLCLWSVNSGTFLGKIGHDKELEEGGSVDGGWDEPPPRNSIAEDIGKLRIHSGKVSNPRLCLMCPLLTVLPIHKVIKPPSLELMSVNRLRAGGDAAARSVSRLPTPSA